MKKLLPSLLFLAAFGAAGATVYLSQKPTRGGSAPVAADYLPPETVALLALPDLAQTISDWKTTDLYKIWAEPDVQAFLAKPLSKIPPNKDLADALSGITKLEPKNLFIALTALDEKNNHPHLMAGFQFKGSSADVDHLLAAPKKLLRKKSPVGKADLIDYEGHSLETFDDGEGNAVASVYLGNWYLISNDMVLLKSSVDRFDHRASAEQATLASEADFQAVLAKLPKGYSTLIFARAQPFLERLYALGAASGQTVAAEDRAESAKLKAVGATTQIESGKMRDTMYVLAPGHKPREAALQMSGLPLSTTDTLLYFAAVLDLPKHFDLPADQSGSDALGANPFAFLSQITTALEKMGLKMDDFRAAFGREATFQLDWPEGTAQPTVLLSLDVRDPAAADKFLNHFNDLLTTDAGWQPSRADGVTYRTLSSPDMNFVSPTLTLTSKHFIFGLNPPEVHDAVAREKNPVANFMASDAYKSTVAGVEKANVDFGYIDSAAFFERIYAVAKPAIVFGAAFAFPKAAEYVDLGKLPDAEVISKHLSPTVLSETMDNQGILMESTGSFTFTQATTCVGLAAGAVAVPVMQQRLGGAHVAPAKPDSDEESNPPMSKPSASPQGTPDE